MNKTTAKKQNQAQKTNEIKTSKKANYIYNSLPPLNPNKSKYLQEKRIINKSCDGLKKDYHGTIVLPVTDVNNKIHSLGFIEKTGQKHFLSNGSLASNFFSFGSNIEDTKYIHIAVLTAMSIRDATDEKSRHKSMYVVAFNVKSV